MQAFSDFCLTILGPDGHPTELTLLQVSVRCLVIFVFGLALVRIGDRRSLAEKTGFDTLFIILLGSVLSRAINGSAGLLVTLEAGTVLMFIHRGFAFVSYRSHTFGKVIKGRDIVLVRDGQIDQAAMKKKLVSQHDLEEDLRLHAKGEDLSTIRVARLERSGDISFIKTES